MELLLNLHIQSAMDEFANIQQAKAKADESFIRCAPNTNNQELAGQYLDVIDAIEQYFNDHNSKEDIAYILNCLLVDCSLHVTICFYRQKSWKKVIHYADEVLNLINNQFKISHLNKALVNTSSLSLQARYYKSISLCEGIPLSRSVDGTESIIGNLLSEYSAIKAFSQQQISISSIPTQDIDTLYQRILSYKAVCFLIHPENDSDVKQLLQFSSLMLLVLQYEQNKDNKQMLSKLKQCIIEFRLIDSFKCQLSLHFAEVAIRFREYKEARDIYISLLNSLVLNRTKDEDENDDIVDKEDILLIKIKTIRGFVQASSSSSFKPSSDKELVDQSKINNSAYLSMALCWLNQVIHIRYGTITITVNEGEEEDGESRYNWLIAEYQLSPTVFTLADILASMPLQHPSSNDNKKNPPHVDKLSDLVLLCVHLYEMMTNEYRDCKEWQACEMVLMKLVYFNAAIIETLRYLMNYATKTITVSPKNQDLQILLQLLTKRLAISLFRLATTRLLRWKQLLPNTPSLVPLSSAVATIPVTIPVIDCIHQKKYILQTQEIVRCLYDEDILLQNQSHYLMQYILSSFATSIQLFESLCDYDHVLQVYQQYTICLFDHHNVQLFLLHTTLSSSHATTNNANHLKEDVMDSLLDIWKQYHTCIEKQIKLLTFSSAVATISQQQQRLVVLTSDKLFILFQSGMIAMNGGQFIHAKRYLESAESLIVDIKKMKISQKGNENENDFVLLLGDVAYHIGYVYYKIGKILESIHEVKEAIKNYEIVYSSNPITISSSLIMEGKNRIKYSYYLLTLLYITCDLLQDAEETIQRLESLCGGGGPEAAKEQDFQNEIKQLKANWKAKHDANERLPVVCSTSKIKSQKDDSGPSIKLIESGPLPSFEPREQEGKETDTDMNLWVAYAILIAVLSVVVYLYTHYSAVFYS